MKKVLIGLTLLAVMLTLGFVTTDANAQGRVVGVVVDAEGNSVAGAHVMLHQLRPGRGERPFLANTISGRDGSFGFGAVPAGMYMVGAVSRELQAANRMRLEVADNGARVRIELQARQERERPDLGDVPTGNLTVTVTADGNAVAGARVHLMPVGRMARGPVRLHGETGRDGTITFEGIPAVGFMVMAGHPEFGRGQSRALVEEDGDANAEVQLFGRRGGNNGGGERGGDDNEDDNGDNNGGGDRGGNGGDRGGNGGGDRGGNNGGGRG